MRRRSAVVCTDLSDKESHIHIHTYFEIRWGKFRNCERYGFEPSSRPNAFHFHHTHALLLLLLNRHSTSFLARVCYGLFSVSDCLIETLGMLFMAQSYKVQSIVVVVHCENTIRNSASVGYALTGHLVTSMPCPINSSQWHCKLPLLGNNDVEQIVIVKIDMLCTYNITWVRRWDTTQLVNRKKTNTKVHQYKVVGCVHVAGSLPEKWRDSCDRWSTAKRSESLLSNFVEREQTHPCVYTK